MIAYRLCKRKYAGASDVLGGRGARKSGGRWNAPGNAMVYASTTSSLALLETLVHVDPALLPRSLVLVEIVVPDDAPFGRIETSDLPKAWRNVGNRGCVERGTAWLHAAKELALLVPSAVNPSEHNVLLNPLHPDIRRCVVGPPKRFRYDARLISMFAP